MRWPWKSDEELRARDYELFFGTPEPAPPGILAYLSTNLDTSPRLTREAWDQAIERIRNGGL